MPSSGKRMMQERRSSVKSSSVWHNDSSSPNPCETSKRPKPTCFVQNQTWALQQPPPWNRSRRSASSTTSTTWAASNSTVSNFASSDRYFILITKMLKRTRVVVLEVKTIGLKPSAAKPEEVFFERDSSYGKFCKAIKEKFKQFDIKKYVVAFPLLAGVTLTRHNFAEFLENVGSENKQYSEIHIQKVPYDTYLNISSGEDYSVESEDDDGVVLMAKMVDDDKFTEEEMAFLHNILIGDPTDASVRLTKDDCRLLEGMQVLTKEVCALPTLGELETEITTRITKDTQQC